MYPPCGFSLIAALCDELAFWPVSEYAAEPDSEILNAIRPGLSNIPGSMLLCASSPYARKGELWSAHQRYYGKDDGPLCGRRRPGRCTRASRRPWSIAPWSAMPRPPAPNITRSFAATLKPSCCGDAVAACVTPGIIERPPEPGVAYFGFADPAGGSGGDDMTLAIAHYDHPRQTVIIDALRWFKPLFSPRSRAANSLLVSRDIRLLLS